MKLDLTGVSIPSIPSYELSFKRQDTHVEQSITARVRPEELQERAMSAREILARCEAVNPLEARGYVERRDPPEKLPVEAELTAILKEQGKVIAVVSYPEEKSYQLIEAPDFRKLCHVIDKEEERLECVVEKVSPEDRCFEKLPIPVTVHDGCLEVEKAASLEQERIMERELRALARERQEKDFSYEMDGP